MYYYNLFNAYSIQIKNYTNCYYKKCKYILCNIDFGVYILFPKCVVNAAFRKQNGIPYFLGQFIYVALYQCIAPAFSRTTYICSFISMYCPRIFSNILYILLYINVLSSHLPIWPENNIEYQ